MKVKNLLLAGLAVAAMTACSNNDEIVDNGITTEKNASMRFGISLPQGQTRAGSGTITNGEKEVGIPTENAFTDITVVIDYATTRDVMTFAFADFEKDATNKQVLYLKESIPVTATTAVSTATVSAFVNASDALKADLKAKTTTLDALKVTSNYTNSLDNLEDAGGIAEANKFLMSGSKSNQTFAAGTSTPITVPVDRVAAKLVERSKATAFDIKNSALATDATLAITLEEYNFVNLLQDTYTLSNATTITSDLFNAYKSDAATAWNAYTADAKTITGPTEPTTTTNITYCTENLTATTTNVLYKATAKWNGAEAASTFYVTPDNKVYLTFAELAAVYNVEGLTDNSSIADFAAKSIKKYDGGVCYYKSNAIGDIVRNNVYYLNVTSIADLGDPTPGDTPTPATINLTVAVNPWTINIVDIEL